MERQPRDFDFSPRTRRVISARAGYRCSYPGCGRPLIGPGEGADGIISLGEVAHIYSGSQEGPRYDKSISKEQLQSPQNGVFLCRHHHRLVDSIETKFTSADLIRMKDRHEFQISSEIGVLTHPAVWIDSITINQFSLFQDGTNVSLGRINHIYGEHGLGKTAFLEVLSAALTSIPNDRWQRHQVSLNIRVRSGVDRLNTIAVRMKDNRVTFQIGQRDLPLFAEPYFVVYLRRSLRRNADDVEAIRSCYDFPQGFLERLIATPGLRGITTSDYSLETTRTVPYISRNLRVEVGNNWVQTFDTCSGSEQGRVVLDLGIAAALSMCRHRPVVLLIDWVNITSLNIERFVPYIDFLFSSQALFQTIFVSPDPIEKLPWTGWQRVELKEGDKGTVVVQ